MGGTTEAAPYLAFHIFGTKLVALLEELFADAAFVGIDDWVRALGALKTKRELDRIRQACAVAKRAYAKGASQLRAGMKESEAAQLFRGSLIACHAPGPREYIGATDLPSPMSGPNSARRIPPTRGAVVEPSNHPTSS